MIVGLEAGWEGESEMEREKERVSGGFGFEYPVYALFGVNITPFSQAWLASARSKSWEMSCGDAEGDARSI